jgi:hypothetical protein
MLRIFWDVAPSAWGFSGNMPDWPNLPYSLKCFAFFGIKHAWCVRADMWICPYFWGNSDAIFPMLLVGDYYGWQLPRHSVPPRSLGKTSKEGDIIKCFAFF